MGLSHEERLSKLHFAVNHIVNYGHSLSVIAKKRKYFDHKETVEAIVVCVDNLWHDFLGNNSNSLHWFMGSSASNIIDANSDQQSPWEIAIANHIHIENDKDEEDTPKFSLKQDTDVFDAMKYLSIEDVLLRAENGEILAKVYLIFAPSENAIYSLRRYKDDFLSRFEKLSQSISKILGLCFNIFQDEQNFARAYVLNQICGYIYNDSNNAYPYAEDKFDIITQFLSNQYLHHDLSGGMKDEVITFMDLIRLHKRLIKTKRQNKSNMLFERLRACLIICGHKFNYDYKHTSLSSLIKDASFNKQQIREIAQVLETRKSLQPKTKKEIDYKKAEFNREYSPYGYIFDLTQEEKKTAKTSKSTPKKKK